MEDAGHLVDCLAKAVPAMTDATGTNATRTVYAEFKLVGTAGDEDVKRIIDALNAVALPEDAIEAWELTDEKATR